MVPDLSKLITASTIVSITVFVRFISIKAALRKGRAMSNHMKGALRAASESASTTSRMNFEASGRTIGIRNMIIASIEKIISRKVTNMVDGLSNLHVGEPGLSILSPYSGPVTTKLSKVPIVGTHPGCSMGRDTT